MQQESQEKRSQLKETLKFMDRLTFYGNILTELEKDMKTLQELTLDILRKTGMNTPRISISWI